MSIGVSRRAIRLPLFAERLTLISSSGHRPIRAPQDVHGDSVIALPHGCAYRRRMYRWLGETGAASVARAVVRPSAVV